MLPDKLSESHWYRTGNGGTPSAALWNSITLDLKQHKKQLTDEIKGSEALIHKQKFSGGLYSDYSRLVKPLQLLGSTTLSGELKVSLPVMSSIVAAL